MADDLPLATDEVRRRLALPPDRQYGIDPGPGNDRGYAFNQWLPVSTNKVGSGSWVQQGADPKLAVPEIAQGGLLGVAGMADAPRTGKLTPEALGSLLTGSTLGGGLLAPRGSLAAGGSIKAYHGSPHDFDRFKFENTVGTGEGSQAYGHGLYFAENEGVARSYRDALGGDAIDLGGKKVTPTPGSPQDMALAWLRSAPQDAEPFAAARRNLRSTRDAPETTPAMRERYDGALKALDDWQLAGGKPTAGGHMYEVNINADPQKFLNYDKPLSQQSPDVQQALSKFGIKADPVGMSQFDDALLAALQDKGPTKLPRQPSDPLGANIYESSKLVPGGYRDPAAAAATLKDAGIPGVKYLDQGSRGWMVHNTYKGEPYSNPVKFPTQQAAQAYATEQEAKGFGTRVAQEGTSNYVVFPTQDEIIQILRKYGLAAPSPAVPSPQGPAPTTPGLLSDQQSEVPMQDRVY